MADVTVTAVLDQDRALAASVALVERLDDDAKFLRINLERLITEGLHARSASEDSQATARELMHTLAALGEIGWPHELTQPNRLRELREAGEWSVEEFAQRGNLDESDVRRWERGHTIPDLEAERIAYLAGVSTEYLLCEEVAS